MPFTFERASLPDIVIIKPRQFSDNRGLFMETYKQSDFKANGIDRAFVQDNHSHSVQGVLRGLHYQTPPHAQAKLVRCLRGRIFDVAVDIRRSSPQFGQWFAYELDGQSATMLYIPEGFAHGFYTLSDEAEVLYKVTAEYAPQHDCGIRWNDPEIGIEWPDGAVYLSDRDKNHPLLNAAELPDNFAK